LGCDGDAKEHNDRGQYSDEDCNESYSKVLSHHAHDRTGCYSADSIDRDHLQKGCMQAIKWL
jgi:hypothetical protein